MPTLLGMSITIDWPIALRPAEVEWGLFIPQEVQRAVLDGSPQVDILGAPRWQFQITSGPLKLDEAPAWEALIDRLRGSINRVRCWDWRREGPLGPATGTPVVAANGSGNTLALSGWAPNITAILKAGSYLDINGELKRLSGTINSSATGTASITFEPPLRNAVTVGVAVGLFKPSALFILKGNPPPMVQKGARCPGVTLAFEEVFS